MKPKKQNGEFLFLEKAASRWKDFWGAFGIMLEFIRGFRRLHFVGPCITVFGSARFKEDHAYYKEARHFGQAVAQTGFTVMTGGGPGIMEAANRGAKDVGGHSVGCNIVLPKEQAPSPYLDLMILMDHFYVRKVLLLKYSYAFVVLPGGFGTLDELFETLTLIQTQKINLFPVVLFGKDYWKNLLAQLDDMANSGTIDQNDTSLFLLTDSVEEGMAYIMTRLKEKYGQEVKLPAFKNRWWLGEKAFFTRRQHFIKL